MSSRSVPRCRGRSRPRSRRRTVTMPGRRETLQLRGPSRAGSGLAAPSDQRSSSVSAATGRPSGGRRRAGPPRCRSRGRSSGRKVRTSELAVAGAGVVLRTRRSGRPRVRGSSGWRSRGPHVVDDPVGRVPGKRVRGHGAGPSLRPPDRCRGRARPGPWPAGSGAQPGDGEHDGDQREREDDRRGSGRRSCRRREVAGVRAGGAAPPAAPHPGAQSVRRRGRHERRRDEPGAAAAAEPPGRVAGRAAVAAGAVQRHRAPGGARDRREHRARCGGAARHRRSGQPGGTTRAADRAAGVGRAPGPARVRSAAGSAAVQQVAVRPGRRVRRARGGGNGVGRRGAAPVEEPVAVLAELSAAWVAGATVLAHHPGHRIPLGPRGRPTCRPSGAGYRPRSAGKRSARPPRAAIRKNGVREGFPMSELASESVSQRLRAQRRPSASEGVR